MSKDCCCFTKIIYHNSKDLVRTLTKIGTHNCLGYTTSVPNFSHMSLWVGAIFSSVRKNKEENLKKKRKICKFAHSHLRNGLQNFLQIWYVVSSSRWAPPQKLWHPSDKRSQSYECMKIATLLFLLIYSPSQHESHFPVPHVTLPRVLIYTTSTTKTSCWLVWQSEIIQNHIAMKYDGAIPHCDMKRCHKVQNTKKGVLIRFLEFHF